MTLKENSWGEPKPIDRSQLFLFHAPTDEVLAELRVSVNEGHRWFENGWLTFDVQTQGSLSFVDEREIQFICSIVRSGISEALIDRLLRELRRPYCYDCDKVAYSFTHGWVALPQRENPFDVVERHLPEWLNSLVDRDELDKLEAVRDQIDSLLPSSGRAEGSER